MDWGEWCILFSGIAKPLRPIGTQRNMKIPPSLTLPLRGGREGVGVGLYEV